MRLRRTAPHARIALIAAAILLATPAPAPAGDGAGAVAVFEGVGFGHGLGLPFDGASLLAGEGVRARQILGRFFPGTTLSSASGLVRVLVATSDDPGRGLDVDLPRGGTIRDGRAVPVAPSFPIVAAAGDTVRITADGDFSRAEVLDDRSVSETREVTDGAAGSATRADEAPPLASSPHSIWIEPRSGGSVEADEAPEGARGLAHALHEVVVEAERLHLVAELDVEQYLGAVDFTHADGTPLEGDALDAAVIAARTYALRAAASEDRVGRFHLFPDERSHPLAEPESAQAGTRESVRRAVRRTSGRVLRHDGELAAAMTSRAGGGTTASASEALGTPGDRVPYLVGVRYAPRGGTEWSVAVEVTDLADAVEYEGAIEALDVTEAGSTGRPLAIAVSGSSGRETIEAQALVRAVGLPSTLFTVGIEESTGPLPARTSVPELQDYPGDPIRAPAAPGAPTEVEGSGSDLPPWYVMGAVAVLAVTLLAGAAVGVGRRVAASRARRRARARLSGRRPRRRDADRATPTTPPAEVLPPDDTSGRDRSDHPVDDGAGAPEPAPPDADPRRTDATWDNEPSWLREIVPDDEEAPEPGEIVDDRTLRRAAGRDRTGDSEGGTPVETEDVVEDEEPPPTRPLREVLGWNDAPPWLDEPGGSETAGPAGDERDEP